MYGLDGWEELSEQDEVAIFYTQNRCGLTFDLHKRLVACKASLRLMEYVLKLLGKMRQKMHWIRSFPCILAICWAAGTVGTIHY